MKRIITLITLVLVSASTLMYAQSSSETRQAERKAQREAQKAREKAENERNYAIAVQRNRRHHSGRQQKGNENHDRQKGKRELQLQRTRHRNIRTSVYHTDQRRQ